MKKIILLVLSLILSISLFADGNKTITAVSNAWAPFVDPENAKEGLSMEIIRAAYKTQGYEVKLKYMPWARAEDLVRKGKYDILPDVWYTESRAKDLMYSDDYAENKIKFIILNNDDFEFIGLESLEGKKIGVVRGYGYIDELSKVKDLKMDEVGNEEANIKKLLNKRIDLTLGDEIVTRVTIANDDPKILEKIKFTKNALSSNKLYIASGYKNPRHKEIIEAFNKGLKILKENGEFEKIMKNYGF